MSNEDAELLELGRELAVWRAAEKAADQVCLEGGSDAAADTINEMGSAVAAKIVALRATTLAGLQVKACAAAFLLGGGGEGFTFGKDATGDMAAAAAVVDDLLRMGGAQAPLPV